MKKTAEWYEIDNLIPDGTWYNHANEWWLESPDSIFTLRVSKLGEKVDWWMYRKSSPWLSGQFFTSYESMLGKDVQLFDMVLRDYESKAWGLDDLVMSDPYRYSKKSVRKRANESGRRATKEGTTMKPNLFQQYELDALLGEFADDFDIDGIIEDATIVDCDGDRVWTAFGDDLYRIIEEHDMHNSDYIRGAFRSEKTALLDDDVYRQSMQIVDDVEGELDYENAYYSHDTLLSMYDIMRDAIDAFATSKFLGSDESLLSRQWQEAIDRTEDFLDATGSIFTAREVVHAYADIVFAKHDRPYFRDVYGSRRGQSTLQKSANTYQDAANLPAYNMDVHIQSAAECVNAVFSGAGLLDEAASWLEYNAADVPLMRLTDRVGDIAAEAYVIGKDIADAWDAGARSAGRKLAFDDAPEYAIADKYRDFDDARQYVNMSDDEIIRESAKHAAYEWFGWSGSFKSISDSHFQMVVWNGIDRVARNIFSAQERVKVGVETNDEWRALKSEDPEAWEALRDDLEVKIDERCAAIEPIVSQLLLDAIEDCRARIESI